MSIYYADLLDVLRAAGCQVAENNITAGWQSRSRSSGGFPAPPLGVWWHHTASSTSPDNDLNYMINASPDRPVGNMLIDRDGVCWPIAAGACNCAGKGGPTTFSRGVCPLDQGNTHGWQIEVANSGVGEAWPQAQIDAFFAASNALNAHFGNLPIDIVTHQSYAPTRKIDPATADAVQGPWRPVSCTSSGSWSVLDIAAECLARAGSPAPPHPTPDEEDDDMLFDGFWQRDNDTAVYALFKDGTKKWVGNDSDLAAAQALYTVRGATPEQTGVRVQPDPAMWTAFGTVIGPQPNDGRHRDEWGNLT